jgi:putative membrane protein
MSTSEFLVSAWDWKPSVILGCAGLAFAYAASAHFRFSRRTASGITGVLLIFLALVSPLDALADRYLFSFHMAKHILFVLVVPALLVMGIPPGPAGRALHFQMISRSERWLRKPAIAWIAGVGAMTFWHIPALFNSPLSSDALHITEHLSLVICGTIYWWPILSPLHESRMKPVPQAAAYLFTSCLACTTIGILITFASTLLYPAYAHPVDIYGFLPVIRETWGISATMDQQIGGLLMWVPACFVYLSAIMAMFARWYAEDTGITVEA